MQTEPSISADLPITDPEQDQFQRFDFAQRIAEMIKKRAGDESQVIGLMGAWGEGKTSVLNLIEGQLKGEFNLECIRFNPWRYQNEDTLLKNFFEKVAGQVGFRIGTRKEKVRGWFKKYGAATKVLKVDTPHNISVTVDLSELGRAISDVKIETFKNRISEQLLKTKTKLVIFLDDLDRLDKEEIFAVFRLVKLTADFSNTTYIISFDEELVANAIAERYGEKNSKAGSMFLEKIIQFPLRLPMVQPYALNQFCYGLMQQSFQEHQVELSQDEHDRFALQFTTNILPKLTNPRLAVRYNNALSFALSMLVKEVNVVDLLLLEAVKTFFPPYYNFIKEHPDDFVENISRRVRMNINAQTRSKEIHAKLGAVMPELPAKDRQLILDLLMDMFPFLKSSYMVSHDSSQIYYDQWYKEKRICTTQYFERYFSYTVFKGQLSDINFDQLINNLDQLSSSQVADLLKEMMKEVAPGRLTEKLRYAEKAMPWEKAKVLIEAICLSPDIVMGPNDPTRISFTTAAEQAAMFIGQIYRKEKKRSDTFEHAKQVVSSIPSIPFAMTLLKWAALEKDEADWAFSSTEMNELRKMVIDKAVAAAAPDSIFEVFDNDRYYLTIYWNEIDKKGLIDYTRPFYSDMEKLLHFMQLFVTKTSNKLRPVPFLTNLTKHGVDFLKLAVDLDELSEAIGRYFSEEELNGQEAYMIDQFKDEEVFSPLNMIRQFLAVKNGQDLSADE